MATLFEVSADRTAVDIVLAVSVAPMLVVPRTETVALIRTASGTMVVVPVALIVMYRVSAAEAGTARPTPEIRVSAITEAVTAEKWFSFMSLLSLKALYWRQLMLRKVRELAGEPIPL